MKKTIKTHALLIIGLIKEQLLTFHVEYESKSINLKKFTKNKKIKSKLKNPQKNQKIQNQQSMSLFFSGEETYKLHMLC